MSSVNAIGSNVSFGRAKKADKAEKQPKVSKHIQKRAMEKYGVDYMSLSPEAQKIIKKDINFEYAAIGLSVLGTAGLSLAFAKNQKLLNGLTESVINTGKKIANKVTGTEKFQVADDAKDLGGFLLLKVQTVLNGKEIKRAETQSRDFFRDVLGTITETSKSGKRVNVAAEDLQEFVDNSEGLSKSAQKTVENIKDIISKYTNPEENIAVEDLDGLAEGIKAHLNKANGEFNTSSKLHGFITKLFGNTEEGLENAAKVEKVLSGHGITDGASAIDSTLAGAGAVGAGLKAGDVMDDATDLNNKEVTEEAVIAHIQAKGSAATLRAMGEEALHTFTKMAKENLDC